MADRGGGQVKMEPLMENPHQTVGVEGTDPLAPASPQLLSLPYHIVFLGLYGAVTRPYLGQLKTLMSHALMMRMMIACWPYVYVLRAAWAD